MQLATYVLTLCGMLMGPAYGQVRKCIGQDGKVTYSDSICGIGTAKEDGVRVNANTIDSSGLRGQVDKYRGDEAVEKATQQGSKTCKFASYAYGDEKGKALAAEAKEECLSNIAAKARGLPQSLDAYNMWKDHFEQKSAGRRAAVTQIQNAENARAIADSNRNAINAVGNQLTNKTYKCSPNLLGNALDCK
jgi:hypothetical protein